MFSRNSAQLLSLFPSKSVMPKRDAAGSIMSSKTKQPPPPPPPQQTSIQHQQAKGHKAAAAAGEASHRRTAAYPVLLSNCSQLTLTKGPFSEAVTAHGGAKSKGVRQPEPWSQPLHIFWGPISLPLIDYLFLTMQQQGSVSCSTPKLASLL